MAGLPFDAGSLRKTSTESEFPWLQKSVTMLMIGSDGTVRQAKTDADKRALLSAATEQDLVLAAWPGQWTQDIFVVDDLLAARMEIGVPVTATSTVGTAQVAAPTAAMTRYGDATLWHHLAAYEGLPPAGQSAAVQAVSTDYRAALSTFTLFDRDDLTPQARQVIVGNARFDRVAKLIAHPRCLAEHALQLVRSHPADLNALDAGLRRSDIRAAVWQTVTGKSYAEAAKLAATDARHDRTELAWALLQPVLAGADSLPWPREQERRYGLDPHDPPAVIVSLFARVSSDRQEFLLGEHEHASSVRRALMARGTDLTDTVLLACLPDILSLDTGTPAKAQAAAARLCHLLNRHPRLGELAATQVAEKLHACCAAGWSPEQLARLGHWDQLLTVAVFTDDTTMLTALAAAAVHDRPSPVNPMYASKWTDARRYRLAETLALKATIDPAALDHLLNRLSGDVITGISAKAGPDSAVGQACQEVLAMHSPGRAPHRRLPADEELSRMGNPAAALAAILRAGHNDRERVQWHVLDSTYCTDAIAWSMPVQVVERHPVHGPRLAAQVSAICADSPQRWGRLTQSLSKSNRLLASTLLQRLRDVKPGS